MVIEIASFRLSRSAPPEVEEFLAADAALQADVMIHDEGFVRRITARSGDEWAVVSMWWTHAHAEAAAQRAAASAAGRAFAAHVDQATVDVRRFESLD
jgi:ribonuclease BN (tRNA processing enzyme)